jgi:hypothetical protein
VNLLPRQPILLRKTRFESLRIARFEEKLKQVLVGILTW